MRIYSKISYFSFIKHLIYKKGDLVFNENLQSTSVVSSNKKGPSEDLFYWAQSVERQYYISKKRIYRFCNSYIRFRICPTF